MKIIFTLVAALFFLFTVTVFAEEITPATNLAGIKKVHEKIPINLNLQGAEDFHLDPEKIKTEILTGLNSVGIETSASGVEIPTVSVLIDGESTGGGGAQYRIELVLHALIPSPFAKNRSIEAVLWRSIVTDNENMRWDSASKTLINPSGSIDERVYGSVNEVVSRLVSDFKKATLERPARNNGPKSLLVCGSLRYARPVILLRDHTLISQHHMARDDGGELAGLAGGGFTRTGARSWAWPVSVSTAVRNTGAAGFCALQGAADGADRLRLCRAARQH